MYASTSTVRAAHALPRKGLTVALPHERYTFVAVSADRREAYTICKIVTEPLAGPPPHIHHCEDEAWMILEGSYTVRIGDRVRTLGPGAFVVAPKNVPHTYQNAGSLPGMLLATIWPAGRFEQLLMEIGVVLDGEDASPPDVGLPDARTFTLAAPRYGIEVVPELKPRAER